MTTTTEIKINVKVYENKENRNILDVWANEETFTAIRDFIDREKEKEKTKEQQEEKKPDKPFGKVMDWLKIDTSKLGIMKAGINAINRVIAQGWFCFPWKRTEYRLTLVKNKKEPEYTVK